VIFRKAGDSAGLASPASQEQPLGRQIPPQKIRGFRGGLEIAGLAKRGASLGKRRNHESVPRSKNLVVEMRARALRALFGKLGAANCKRFRNGFCGDSEYSCGCRLIL